MPKAGQGVLSRDGNLFSLSLTRQSETTMVRKNLATGEERELIRIPHVTGPFFALSPDERHLVFADRIQRATALKIIPAAGGEVRELLSLEEPTKQYISPHAGFAWTPGGSHVYFGRSSYSGSSSALPMGTTQIFRVPVEGGEPQAIGLEVENLSELRIHPDGRRIAFPANHQKATREL